MAETTYTKSVSADFGGQVNLSALTNEIRNSEITVSLARVDRLDDQIFIVFRDSLDPTDLSVLDQVVSAHDGSVSSVGAIPVEMPSVKFTGDGKIVTSANPPELSKVTIVTPRWNDETTWYDTAQYHEDVPLTIDPSFGTSRHFKVGVQDGLGKSHIIDTVNGKIWKEDFLKPPAGSPVDSYRVRVTVDGVEKLEHTLETENAGLLCDYKVHYQNGIVEFFDAPPVGADVRASFWMPQNSKFHIVPLPGKILRLTQVEIQFSEDVSITDTVQFTTYGYLGALLLGLSPQEQQQVVAQYAEELIAQGEDPMNPDPMAIVTFRGPLRYKSMGDFMNEANGTYPGIPPTTAPKEFKKGRDLENAVITFPWRYQSVVSLFSSAGMYVVMEMQNDVPLYGEFATATFYGFSEDDPNWQG